MNSIVQLISRLNIPYRTDCTFSDLTTFKVGGRVDLVLYPETVEQCSALIAWAKKTKEKLIFLGNGSNVLGSDNGYRGIIVKTDRLNEIELCGNGIINVGAGVRGVKVSSFAAKNGLSGIEFLHGIPGTIGGAVFMNAGAYDGSMDQVVLQTRYLDEEGNVHILKKEDHHFGYRKSFFMEHPTFLILDVTLQLQPGNKEEILSLINDLQQRRREKQPLEYPSAGSTFKRPEGHFAGKLIQDAGLGGYSIGGAQVSSKHCGFIINSNDATCKDVLDLVQYVQDVVLKQFDVQLECEIRFLGEK